MYISGFKTAETIAKVTEIDFHCGGITPELPTRRRRELILYYSFVL